MADDAHSFLITLGCLAASAVFGGIVGYERERRGQAAGFRTNMLVGVAACLLGQLSLYVATIAHADAARIASYAVSGIGFIGGGAILKGKSRVRGLTTAAMLWVVTGIGLAIGMGMYTPAACASVVVSAIIYLSPQMHGVVSQAQRHYLITVESYSCAIPYDELQILFKKFGCIFSQMVDYGCDNKAKKHSMVLRIVAAEDTPWSSLISAARELDNITSVHVSECGVP